MTGAYYNEHNKHAAQWLRNLIKLGVIAPGEVDERSILDVAPDDLRGFAQCHFFAGIGVWSYALRLAGIGDGDRVWTGSCPCQPFSEAGAGAGFADERHLWPAWHWLIQECRPRRVYGEQVASVAGLGWLDLVQADLQGTGYTGVAVDFCAASVGAPHIRQRLYFVADALRTGLGPERGIGGEQSDERLGRDQSRAGVPTGRLADADRHGRDARVTGDGRRQIGARREYRAVDDRRGAPHLLADSDGVGSQGRQRSRELLDAQRPPAERGGEARRVAYADGGKPGDRDLQPRREQRFEPTDGRVSGVGEPVHAERRSIGRGRDRAHAGRHEAHGELGSPGQVRRLADAGSPRRREILGRAHGDENSDGRARRHELVADGGHVAGRDGEDGRPGPTNGFWRDADWLLCTDERWRPVEPGSFPLVNGSAFDLGSGGAFEGKSRAKMLEGYGNAINAYQAAAFIRSTI